MVYRTSLPLLTLRREVDRLFDDAFGRPEPSSATWSPIVDVREESTGFIFELELPGVDPTQVEVTAEEGVLTVTGSKETARSMTKEGRWHLSERIAGSFKRAFRLPPQASEEGITASYAHGVLTISVPRVVQPAPRKIEVVTRG